VHGLGLDEGGVGGRRRECLCGGVGCWRVHGAPEGECGVNVWDGEGGGERSGSEAERGRERLWSAVGAPAFGRACCEGFVLDVP
jgi:hypothetical protein